MVTGKFIISVDIGNQAKGFSLLTAGSKLSPPKSDIKPKLLTRAFTYCHIKKTNTINGYSIHYEQGY